MALLPKGIKLLVTSRIYFGRYSGAPVGFIRLNDVA